MGSNLGADSPKMKTSDAGINLIKSYETCRLKAYKPTPDDVWTCGWGSTDGVTESTVWTQEQADAALRDDLEDAERCINKFVRVPLTQNEFDALVSLTFNIGCNAFSGSTLLKLLNSYDYDGAAAQFPRWDKQKGQPLAGLTRRRKDEQRMFA